MKTTCNVEYCDADTHLTMYLVAKEYNVQILDFQQKEEGCWNVLACGEPEDVEAFREAVESGDPDPLYGWRDLDDEEYLGRIQEELAAIGVEWDPNH